MRQYFMVVLLLLLASTLISSTLPERKSNDSVYSVKPTCNDSLQTVIDGASAGTTIPVRTDCIYREQLSINKSITLDGQGEAEIRGSDIWGDEVWRVSDRHWVSTVSIPNFSVVTSDTQRCHNQETMRCFWVEQVFMDGRQLYQVAANTTPNKGQFALKDSVDRRIVLGDDPAGRIVEVTTRQYWVKGYAADVTIKNFTMTHAATDTGNGAITNGDGTFRLAYYFDNWTVDNNDLSLTTGMGVFLHHKRGHKIINNALYSHTTQGGGSSEAANVVISGNTIYNNNLDENGAFPGDINTGWGAGGMKLAVQSNMTISDNEVFNNNGPGIWCDIDCTNTSISNNIVHHNTGSGIFLEISDGAEIFDNKVWENSWGKSSGQTWGWDAGIILAGSSNADVFNNIIAWNGDGISVISQCRQYLENGATCDTTHRWNLVDGNHVYDNYIIMEDNPTAQYNVFSLAWLRDIQNADGDNFDYMYTPDADNWGNNNGYWIPQPEGSSKIRFHWIESYENIDAFNATDGLENEYYLTGREKNQILRAASIPLSPEDHTEPMTLVPTPTAVPTAYPHSGITSTKENDPIIPAGLNDIFHATPRDCALFCSER